MLREIIRKRIIDFQHEESVEYIKRDISVLHVPDMVTTIVGVRKSGKTFLTYQLIDELITNNTINNKEQVCYLHFDDEQLMGLSSEDLYLIDEIFYSVLPNANKFPNVVFIFDEIHKIIGWENFVLRIKKQKNTIVIVTGSSADLEESRVARQLRGKTMTNHLFPLSFKEFLQFQKETELDLDRISSLGIANLIHLFDDYLVRGSFPALTTINIKQVNPILRNYYHSIIETDFLLTEGVGNNIVCKDFVTYLLHNNGGKYTHKKTFNTLRSYGHKFTEDYIPSWLDLAKRCYFINKAQIYSPSIKKIQQNYRKIYCIDWALANAVSFPTEKRISATLETIIYWELRRRGKKVSYQLCSREKYEIDFLVYDYFQKPEFAIQVSYDISSQKVLEREIRPFEYIQKDYPSIKCLLIVKEEPLNKIKIHDDITVIPAWKWLLAD